MKPPSRTSSYKSCKLYVKILKIFKWLLKLFKTSFDFCIKSNATTYNRNLLKVAEKKKKAWLPSKSTLHTWYLHFALMIHPRCYWRWWLILLCMPFIWPPSSFFGRRGIWPPPPTYPLTPSWYLLHYKWYWLETLAIRPR